MRKLIFVVLGFTLIGPGFNAQTPNGAVSHYQMVLRQKVLAKGLDGAIEEYSRAIEISSRLNSSDSETGRNKQHHRHRSLYSERIAESEVLLVIGRATLKEQRQTLTLHCASDPGLLTHI